ncbi:MAG: DUF4174 domain-containing protein [Cyclobacteriaceae bacterium]
MISFLLPLVFYSILWSDLPQEDLLREYRWKNRIVLIFSVDSSHKQSLTQLNELTSVWEDVEERDMLTFLVRKNRVTDQGDQLISAINAASLRNQFSIAEEEFAVLLIGKDGGVKLRSKEEVIATDLFGLIDGMPMRRGEIRRKKW